MQPQTQAVTLLEAICGTLALARSLVQSQRRVDLDGLQESVGRLCAACLDLPPDQGREMLPRLNALLAELDSLTSAFVAAERDVP
jgi:hypothetical protein